MLLNHTMLRVRDPAKSLAWYKEHFGMNLLLEMPVKTMGFTNYFIGINGDSSLAGTTPWYRRQGILELCHNHNALEKDFKANNGNSTHRGFGHLCFSVNHLEAFCHSLEQAGVQFQKKLSEGRQKNIAFALDPDGYWVELIENNTASGTRFNHSMIRVKDKDASLEFYQNVLGMQLVRTSEHPAAKFTLFFLSFPGQPGGQPGGEPGGGEPNSSNMEGLIELTYNWETETQEGFSYHNGNSEPQGFGHFGVAVDNVQAAMDHFEAKGAKIVKRLTDGKMKFIGFIADPDGYWIEILPKEDIPKDFIHQFN